MVLKEIEIRDYFREKHKARVFESNFDAYLPDW